MSESLYYNIDHRIHQQDVFVVLMVMANDVDRYSIVIDLMENLKEYLWHVDRLCLGKKMYYFVEIFELILQ